MLYSREIGAMRKRRADEIFGQSLILSAAAAVVFAAVLLIGRDQKIAAEFTFSTNMPDNLYLFYAKL